MTLSAAYRAVVAVVVALAMTTLSACPSDPRRRDDRPVAEAGPVVVMTRGGGGVSFFRNGTPSVSHAGAGAPFR